MGGLDFLLWLQNLSTGWLDTIMGGITQLGGEYFFIAAFGFLYWCVDVRGSMRLFILFCSSLYLTGALKEITAVPRPFQAYPEQIDARLVDTAEEASFPSGHAVNSVVFWGYLAMAFRRRWLYVVAPIIVLLVGFSRLYLGLHWPLDVLGGIIVGLILLGFAYLMLRLSASVPIQARFPATLILCLVPLFFFLLFPSKVAARSMGVLFGGVLGHLLERHYVRFPVRRPAWQQVLKMLIGLAGALLLLVGLGALLGPLAPTAGQVKVVPGGGPPLLGGSAAGWGWEILTFVRYALVALWATLAAPALFLLLFGRGEEETQPLRLHRDLGQKDPSG